MTDRTSPTPLTDEQLAFFEREGYLVVDNLFDDGDLQPVRDEVTAAINERAAALVEAGELSQTYSDEDFAHQLAKISAETDKVARAIWDGRLSGPEFFRLISNPKLLDVAEQLCGPELIASSVYRLRPKIPSYLQGEVPWHQDSGYFEPYCDESLVLTVWIPLVDATRENGCMWVMPRLHNQGVMRHATRSDKPYLFIHDEAMADTSGAVCTPVKAGGALLLTNRTPHASFHNQTDGVRYSMDLRYQSAKLPTNASITRLPDESMPSEEANIPVACYAPEKDFLVRSRLRPDEVVTDPQAFNELRKQHTGGKGPGRWSPVDKADVASTEVAYTEPTG